MISMKKLLLLGINMGTYDMIEYAKSIGVHVILADRLAPDTAPEKSMADEVWALDTSDLDTLERRAREEKVGAVTASSSESNLDMARQLCKRLGLPCFQTDKGWEHERDKKKFKKACLESGLDAPREYIVSYPPFPEELAGVRYPVIVKPVDSYAMTGLSLCRDAAELVAGCQKALSVSKSRKYVVEEYIEGHELAATYLMDNGDIRLINFAESFKTDVMGMPRISVSKSPSRYTEDYAARVNPKVIQLLKKLDCLNGTLFLQMIEKDGAYYCLEYGLRLAAGRYFEFLESLTGLNIMRAAINFALTGSIGENIELANPLHKDVGIVCTTWSKGGTVAKAEGARQVRAIKGIKLLMDIYPPGSTVVADGTVRQMQFHILFTAEDKKQAAQTLREINETLKVYDTQGNDMLVRFEDYGLLLADKLGNAG